MCDAPLVFDKKRVKARKPHRCFECHGLIEPGQFYEREKGIWPDGPMQFDTCLTCSALCSAVWSHSDWGAWDCVEHGGVWETAEGLGLLSFIPYEHPVREARRGKA